MLTKWIISRIPNHEDVKNERVRSAYGKAASLVGIGCNVLLFAGKLVAGLLSGSVAIMADAVNNLSDASSSLISLLGFKLADRPADAEHPYGHGRFAIPLRHDRRGDDCRHRRGAAPEQRRQDILRPSRLCSAG